MHIEVDRGRCLLGPFVQIHSAGRRRRQVVDTSVGRVAPLDSIAQSLESFLLPFFPLAHDDRSTFKDTLCVAVVLC